MVGSARRFRFATHLVGAALAAIVVMTTGAKADGALAVGIANNDPRQGLAYGYQYNKATEGEAKYEALLACLTEKTAPMEAHVACRIVTTFRGQCLAVALDPGAGTPGWGWALGADERSAENKARDNCRAIAGPGRADYCVVDNSDCDTTGPRVAGTPPAQLSTSTEAVPPSRGGGKH